jgi:GNAT superfamily N-acetyltransferase
MSEPFEVQKEQFLISTDKEKLDIQSIADMLSRSYWARGRTRAQLELALDRSLVFGLYENNRQIGLARVISDFSIFAYLCDVIVHEDYRGRGLGTWLVQIVMAYPDLQGLRRWILATRDTHELYRKFGWNGLEHPEFMMEIFSPNPGESPG